MSTNRFWCTTGCTWYIINVISYFTDVLWVNWGSNELVEVTLLCRLIWLFCQIVSEDWFGNKLLNWLISDFFVCVEIWTSVVMQREGKLLKWLKIYQTSLFWIYFSFSYFCYRSAKRKSIINEFLFFNQIKIQSWFRILNSNFKIAFLWIVSECLDICMHLWRAIERWRSLRSLTIMDPPTCQEGLKVETLLFLLLSLFNLAIV